ncbi:MAG TPA: hypothetical protein VFG28_01525 [Syntrophales bacterium]|nr:hypothetical protein [Syntrophales bacterium]
MGKDFFLNPSFQHSIIPFFQRMIRSFFSSALNFGCLPDASREAQPTEKVGAAEPSFPKSANPVEKDGSLL